MAKTAAKKARRAPNSLILDRLIYPIEPLEDVLRLPRAIEEHNAGNPWSIPKAARAIGFTASDIYFRVFVTAAVQFGLVQVVGAGVRARVTLTSLGNDVVAPSSPGQRAKALWSAFRAVEPFRKVEEHYRGKRIPEDEFFLNTLVREFGIARKDVESFAQLFKENLRFLSSFSPDAADEMPGNVGESDGAVTSTSVTRDRRPREHLDTCFVMMPFGQWFDVYYQQIYIPAIRDAGMEPVRADELFHTGSVMEQIWEQVERSKLLLADLSGKNPNVFYELGLAHAAKKPVVFTASDINDVPFDLRHLRVIVYDTRDPRWGDALQQNISNYLRNALKEPAKSIPHPFRSGLK